MQVACEGSLSDPERLWFFACACDTGNILVRTAAAVNNLFELRIDGAIAIHTSCIHTFLSHALLFFVWPDQ